jgi:predicted nucleotidyltransferase component of viral defense system
MITKEQIDALAKDYQIDTFTIIREHFQLLFLSYLYQDAKANKIYFKGGTAIRLLLGSSRFSEDLDFSTTYNKEQIKQILEKLEQAIQKEMPKMQILLLYSGKNGIRYRIKYQPVGFKFPLTIRLDFTQIKNTPEIVVSPLITKFPIPMFPLISHFSNKEILAEKIEALLDRNKGRDSFDVWFLLEKGIPLKKDVNISDLLKKIESYPQAKLDMDLTQFLPRSQREIAKNLKNLLIQKLKSKLQ